MIAGAALQTGVRFSEASMRPIPLLRTALSQQVGGAALLASGTKETKREVGTSSAVDPSIELRLFEALSAIKVWTSQVAMHLGRDIRDRVFAQMDALHEAAEWSAGDSQVNLASYKTMIRAIIHHRINSKPALSIMPSGNVIALWARGTDRLTMEFLPANRVRWLIATSSKDGPERAAGESPLERLIDILRPYGLDGWIDGR